MNKAYRVAMTCAVLPLVVGVSIFLLWLFTRWTWLMVAGVYALFGGLLVFAVGLVGLIVYARKAFHSTTIAHRRALSSTLICGGLLLSNFPVAAGIVSTVVAIETCYTVVVNNSSTHPLDNVRVSGGGCDISFGSIAPGKVTERRFWIKGDGELRFRAVSGTITYDQIIDEYVTQNRGGHRDVRIDPDRKISVGRKTPNNAMNPTVRPVTRLAGLLPVWDSHGHGQGVCPSRPAGYRERSAGLK